MITFQVEEWPDVASEFDVLGRLNFIEAGVGEDKFSYDLDHDTMKNLYECGHVHITTARFEGKLVGYALSIIGHRHLQYKAKYAQYMGIYLLPEYRKGLSGLTLLQKDEDNLRCIGVDVLYGGFTVHKSLKGLFDRLKWRMVEYTYSKVIAG